MKTNADRRAFLTGVAATASSLAISGSPHSGSVASASDPIHRNGTPKFKFSLAAYSYRRLLQGDDASLTLDDFIDDCAKMQLDGTELTSYYFPDPVTPKYLRTLKRRAFRAGLAISGTAIRNDFGYPEGSAERKQWLDHTKKWIDYAEVLGAPVIRIFAGHQQKGTTPEQSYDLMVSGMQESCEYAGKHGIHLALENHGGPTATAAGLLGLVEAVDSPWFGVNLDTGNFHGDDIYGELEKVAPYALNVQVKVVVSGPDKKKFPADFERVAGILKKSGYRGYVVLEYEESGNPREECPKFIDKLREVFR
jgi:sugar phosphate isomerase/epimerase